MLVFLKGSNTVSKDTIKQRSWLGHLHAAAGEGCQFLQQGLAKGVDSQDGAMMRAEKK